MDLNIVDVRHFRAVFFAAIISNLALLLILVVFARFQPLFPFLLLPLPFSFLATFAILYVFGRRIKAFISVAAKPKRYLLIAIFGIVMGISCEILALSFYMFFFIFIWPH